MAGVGRFGGVRLYGDPLLALDFDGMGPSPGRCMFALACWHSRYGSSQQLDLLHSRGNGLMVDNMLTE